MQEMSELSTVTRSQFDTCQFITHVYIPLHFLMGLNAQLYSVINCVTWSILNITVVCSTGYYSVERYNQILCVRLPLLIKWHTIITYYKRQCDKTCYTSFANFYVLAKVII